MKAGLELDGPFENMAPSICRKRPRSQDDELDESIPISKRINSLNIEGRSDCSPESVPSPDPVAENNGYSDLSYKLWQQHLHSVYGTTHTAASKHYQEESTSSMVLPSNLSNCHADLHSQPPQQRSTPNHLLHPQHNAATDHQTELKKYSPELDASSNPYYYHINEILYKAHIARLERLPKSLHQQNPHEHDHHHQQQHPFSFNR